MTLQMMDQNKVRDFSNKIVDAINGGALAMMVSLGHRTGLFDTMAELSASSSAQIADSAGLNERYVREWLGAMVMGGVVDHDAVSGTYYLPPERAAVLTRAASPDNLAVTTQWISVLGGVEDEVAAAFKHGKGVPYSAYRNFNRVMAEESRQTVVAGLHEHILPLGPGLSDRLEVGIDCLDVACGAGRALIELAASYPDSNFVGYDLSKSAIEEARDEAERVGVTNVRFEVKDLSAMDDRGRYDLVTAFDAIHDQAQPQSVLNRIYRSLRSGGALLMQDIQASSHLHHNHSHAFGTFLYTISCMHCMSVSLAQGGPGLGAAWGVEKALDMLCEAGFRNVKVQTLPHDPINYYYICPK